MKRRLLYLILAALFVLHNDFWWWNDSTSVLGMPIGLTYHLLFCFVVAGTMWLLVQHAWPEQLEEPHDETEPRQ